MAVVDIKEAACLNGTHVLHSKANFDTVKRIESKKPEIAVSGVMNKTGNLTYKSQLNGNSHTPIIAESSNFRKEIGDFVSDEGFVKLPRSLWNDPQWKSARPKYKMVFMTLLFNASYTQKTFSISNNLITIGPGQFCTSMRNLIDLCNDGIKFKEDKVDKNIVERSVSLFSKIGFVRQEVRHGKSVFTITHPELYEHFQKQCETSSETKVRQNRDTNEERKEREDMKETIDGAIAPDRSSLLDKEKKEEQGPSIFDEPSPQSSNQINELSEEKKKILPELWKYAINQRVNEGNTTYPKPGITEKDLINWLKIYEIKDVAEAIKMTSNKKILKTYGAYITKLLSSKIPSKKDNVQINDEFLAEIMKKHRCSHLENLKQYVTDNIKRTDYQKNMDPQMFKEMIMRSLEMAQDYDQRKSEYSQDRDYEDDDY